jgi:thiol:disulfide interchange protein DsbD
MTVAAIIWVARSLPATGDPERAQAFHYTHGGIDWQPWSPEAVDEARADGHIVFVEFTADWCANCKLNESIAFTDRVGERFAELKVVPLLADWTNDDARIAAALATFKRNGIPVYVVYSPNGTIVVLDGLIRQGDLLDALDRAAAPRTGG